MERHHQPNHGDRQNEAKNGGERHRRHHTKRVEALKPSQSLARSPKDVAQLVSIQAAISRDLPKEPSAFALSDDQDYVRRWLVQTDDGSKSGWEENDRRDPSTGLVSRDSKRKRKSSSDSSILETLARPRQSPRREADVEQKIITNQDEYQAPQSKQQRRSSSSSEASSHSSASSPQRETFERKPRHKTREDRYEPKKNKHRKRGGEEKRRKNKRETKAERMKAVRKAGEDLMRNFSSKSIGQERLTMRPPQGLGLFNKGRASSPVRRRGVPDLAFSEMEFLQHAHGQLPREAAPDGKSKSREKERRKRQRVQEEIAQFFQPKRSPLQEIGSNSLGSSSSKYRDKDSMDSWQCEQDQNPRSYQLRLPPQNPSGVRDGSKPTQTTPALERILSLRRALPSINHLRPVPDPASKRSMQATSHISWSDSHHTPTSRSQSQLIFNQRPDSPTPESVRQSIERTGIFKDTGIGISERLKYRSPQASGPESLRPPSPSRGEPYSHKKQTTLSDSPMTRHLSILPRLPQVRPQSAMQHVSQPGISHQSDKSGNGPRREINPAVEANGTQSQGKSHLFVQQFDSALGWHRKSGSQRPASVTDGRKNQYDNLALADRAELAKNARIRRPSLTLSANRHADNDLREGGANQPATLAAPAFVDKAANDKAKVNELAESALPEDRDVTKHEPISQVTEEWLPSGHGSQPPHSSGSSFVGHTFAEDVRNKFEIVLDSPALPPRLQTPASMRSHTVAANILPRTECISHLALPVRELSVNRIPLPAVPLSRLTPVTESGPLFLRQLNEQDRGEGYSRYESQFRAERPIRHFEGHMEICAPSRYSTRRRHNQDELVRDYQAEVDLDYLIRSRDTDHRQHEDYDACEGPKYLETQQAQNLEMQRAWHPDLTPIQEQSYESESVEGDSWNYQHQGEGMDWVNELGPGTYEEAQCDLNLRDNGNNVFQTYEREEEEQIPGFWRPHSRY